MPDLAGPPAPDPTRKRFEEIMAPEQELRDALTAIRPLLERDDVEDEEWVAAFEKEVPVLTDAAYRFLEAGAPPAGLTVETLGRLLFAATKAGYGTGAVSCDEMAAWLLPRLDSVIPGAPAAALLAPTDAMIDAALEVLVAYAPEPGDPLPCTRIVVERALRAALAAQQGQP